MRYRSQQKRRTLYTKLYYCLYKKYIFQSTFKNKIEQLFFIHLFLAFILIRRQHIFYSFLRRNTIPKYCVSVNFIDYFDTYWNVYGTPTGLITKPFTSLFCKVAVPFSNTGM